jgi:glycosyltransferase involved in cell wall biosynthesis
MVVSNSLARELQAIIGRQMTVVPNIVDVHRFQKIFPSSEQVVQIGFVGGMNTNVKGLDLLLNACSGLTFPFFLHVAGSGVLIDSYRRQAEELGLSKQCRFYAFINPDQIGEFYSCLHFVVCSSRYETFNVSLIEAMACGLPVLSTKCGGPEDYIQSENGILCERENIDSLRAGIEKMVAKRSEYSALVIKQFAARFSPEHVGKMLLSIYQQAVKSVR